MGVKRSSDELEGKLDVSPNGIKMRDLDSVIRSEGKFVVIYLNYWSIYLLKTFELIIALLA